MEYSKKDINLVMRCGGFIPNNKGFADIWINLQTGNSHFLCYQDKFFSWEFVMGLRHKLFNKLNMHWYPKDEYVEFYLDDDENSGIISVGSGADLRTAIIDAIINYLKGQTI